jgi:DNA repair protein RecO (recombination protein O)
MMRSKTEALVVGKMPLRETSLLVTLLTAKFGVVKAVAKGTRTPRRRYWAPLELLAHLEIVLHRRRSSDIALLTSVEALDMHTAMLGEPYRFGCGCAVAELGRALAPAEQSSEDLLALLCSALKVMERAPKSGLETVFWATCLKALYLLGHGPHLLCCVRCRRETERGGWFSIAEGGMLCTGCLRRPGDEAFPISAPTLMVLSRLMTESLESVASEHLDKAEFARARQLLDRFCFYHLGVRPGQKSLMFLTRMEHARSCADR